jgi:xylose isomerase
MKEFFATVPRIEYKGKGGDALSFKFYNAEEKLGGKTMKEHLRFAMSYWHTLCGDGLDLFGFPTQDKTYGGSTVREAYTNKAYAGFEIMDKLGIDFFCIHDRDIAPEGKTLSETNGILDEYADLLEKLMMTGERSSSGERQTCSRTYGLFMARRPPAMRTYLRTQQRRSKRRWRLP